MFLPTPFNVFPSQPGAKHTGWYVRFMIDGWTWRDVFVEDKPVPGVDYDIDPIDDIDAIRKG